MRRMYTDKQIKDLFCIKKSEFHWVDNPYTRFDISENGYYSFSLLENGKASIHFPYDYFIITPNDIDQIEPCVNYVKNNFDDPDKRDTEMEIVYRDPNESGVNFMVIGKLVIFSRAEY